jgi:hypothetical protein
VFPLMSDPIYCIVMNELQPGEQTLLGGCRLPINSCSNVAGGVVTGNKMRCPCLIMLAGTYIHCLVADAVTRSSGSTANPLSSESSRCLCRSNLISSPSSVIRFMSRFADAK